MMNDNILIEIHIISQNKKSLLDIDCILAIDTTISDLLEIIFTNYNFEPEGIAAMFAFVPFVNDPLEIHKQDCIKTLRDLDFSNGVTIRIIYAGDAV